MTLATLLGSPQPMYLAWGPQLLSFFNDAYAPILADRLDGAMGRPFAELWAEIWGEINPIVDKALAGEGSRFENMRLRMTRKGQTEETWWTFSSSPVRDASGALCGMLAVVNETTAQVLAARRAGSERQRLSRMFEQAPTFMTLLEGPEHRFVLTNPRFQSLLGERAVIGKTVAEAMPEAAAQGYVKLLDEVFRTGAPFRSSRAKFVAEPEPGKPESDRYFDMVYQPLTDEDGAVTGVFAQGVDVTETYLAEQSLRESEAFTRRVLESSRDCIKVLSLEGRLEFMSAGGMGVMEVDDFAAVAGAYWPDFWHGDEYGAAVSAIAHARRGETGRFQGYAPTFKGALRFWDVAVTPIADEAGRPEKLLAISRDITDQHRTAAALVDREARLSLVIQGAKDHAIISTDPSGIITSWSPGASSIFGWTAEAAIGQPIALIYAPEDRAAGLDRQELVNAARAGSASDERWHVTRSGGQVFMNGSVYPLPPDDQGRPQGFLKIARDETLRRRQDEALRRLNETLEQQVSARTAERNLLATIVETTDAFILAADFDHNILALNKASADEFERVYGVRPKVGDNLLALLADQPEHQQEVRAAWSRALAGEEFTFIEQFGRLDRPSYEIKFSTLRDASGKAIGAYQYVYDVTERLRAEARYAEAEEQLRQSQKLEAVGQLTGGVAHDFNNLLTVIRGSIDLLRRPDLSEAKRDRYLDAISSTADRATKLTSQLLAFARRQTLKPERFEVGRSVISIADMIRTLAGSRIEVEIRTPETPCFVNADPNQFDTSLINMAVNARDAMNGQGRLVIAVALAQRVPPIRSHPAIEGPFVTVSLTDSGSGIDPAQLDQIFEPFFTTKPIGEGTGLGLSQVIGFAKQSGGEVQVESVLGHGATFTLYLPRVEPKAAHDEDAQSGLSFANGNGACVLVVEDNAAVRTFANQTLEDLGYATVLAANGEEALAELAADASRFDVVFSDVVMPGMSGIDLGQRIRETHPAIPIVLTSGYSHVLAQKGTFGFELLHKPYSIEQLSAALTRAITFAGARRSSA